jgi:hypothetical protein
MATVADYSIIADAWVVEVNQNTLNFNVPSNVDPGSRSILGFMLKVNAFDTLYLKIRLNGIEVWSWHCEGGGDFPIRFFQEVVPAGAVKPGKNVFSFDSNSGATNVVMVSDVVVWWQAHI